jgi:P27 family predicted phage terminase small subunit
MRRGPLPKSPEIDEIEGNPSNRPARHTPEPEDARPQGRPPAHLSPIAKREWRRLYEPLRLCGVLTVADIGAFEVYCTAYGRWRELEALLKEHGPFLKAANGNRGVSPFYRLCRQAAAELRTAMTDFGLTPPSRDRLGAPLSPLDGSNGRRQIGGRFAHLIGSEHEENLRGKQHGEFAGLIGSDKIPTNMLIGKRPRIAPPTPDRDDEQ